MTIQNAFLKFLTLVNRNATNNKVNVDAPRFIMLFRDIQNRYIEYVLEKRNEDDIRDIQKILVIEKPLQYQSSEYSHYKFALPSDYFNFANAIAIANTDCCKKQRLLTTEVKSEDIEERIKDQDSKPSFDFRETLCYLTEDQIAVYRAEDFIIEDVLLSYYRYPVQVDIEGYFDRNTDLPSSNIDPEFDDRVVNRILLAMSKEFMGINNDTEGYQVAKDRLFTI